MRYLFTLIIIGHFSTLLSQVDSKLLQLADSLYNLKKYEPAGVAYKTYLKESAKTLNPLVSYKTAVCFSKLGDEKETVHWLKQAIKEGVDDVYLSNIRFDINFFPVKHSKQWEQFMHANLGTFEREAEDIDYPEFRNELLLLWEVDQYYRQIIFKRYQGRAPRELAAVTEAVDRYNAKRVEEMMTKIGWPSHSKVGRDGAHAAWNIVQHAVFNPPLMRICLAKMREALENKEVDGIDYAYLYDRYQGVCNLEKIDYGIIRNIPIRDEYMVEQRRREVGFKQSLTDYLGNYKPKSKKEYTEADQKLEETYTLNIKTGRTLFAEGNLEGAAKSYGKAMRCHGHIKMEDILDAAKVYAMLDTPRSRFNAIQKIRTLSARGYSNLLVLKKEEAFNSLRQEKAWIEIVEIIDRYNGVSTKN